MKFQFRYFFIISALSFVCYHSIGQNLSEIQKDRVFKVSQLWGHLSYFHPYVYTKGLNLDSLYALHFPNFIEAKTDTEFAESLNSFLKSFNDPLTFAEIGKGQIAPTSIKLTVVNGIGRVKLSGYFNDFNQISVGLTAINDTISKIKNLIIDCKDLSFQNEINLYVGISGFNNVLLNKPTSNVNRISISHKGFRDETNLAEGIYQTSFNQIIGSQLKASSLVDKKVVFVTSSKGFLPNIALLLKKEGKAVIISNGEPTDWENKFTYNLSENIEVSMRNQEYAGFTLKADSLFNNQEDPVLIAENILNNTKLYDKLSKTTFYNNDQNPKVLRYPTGDYPSLGYRAVALAKMFSTIDYFFPNKDLMDKDWKEETIKNIEPILFSKDWKDYLLSLRKLHANIQDGHGSVVNGNVAKALYGGFDFTIFKLSMIENKPIISKILDDSLAKLYSIEIGDILIERDGIEVEKLIQNYKQYLAFTHEDLGNYHGSIILCQGESGTFGKYKIKKKNSKILEIDLPFNSKYYNSFYEKARIVEPKFKLISTKIGYADLDRLLGEEIDSMFRYFKDTEAIIFDVRGYPNGTGRELASRLGKTNQVVGAMYSRIDNARIKFRTINADQKFDSTDNFTYFYQYIPSIQSGKTKYLGKTIALINERTQSQSEHLCLYLIAANNTKLIGSVSSGSNGEVTRFTVPGGYSFTFSGARVSFPDGKQLQRVGLQPYIYVKPTIKGYRAGKDEVLERAIKYLEKGN